MAPLAERLQELAGAICAERARIESDRRLPPSLLEQLRLAGCFRMVVPARHGGDELPLPLVLRAVAVLAQADGSVGWTVAQAALAQLVLLHLPEKSSDDLFAPGPDLLAAGVFAPKGKAVRDGEGWRVSGRWPFATGIDHAAWVYVSCLLFEERKLQLDERGAPRIGVFVLPIAEVEVHDTWRALGLRGTASHDVEVQRRFCPEERRCGRAMGTTPRIQLVDYGALFVAAVALGVAAGALEDVVALAAGGKRPAMSPRRLAESPVFQDRLGRAWLRHSAAAAFLHSQAERVRQDDLTLIDRATARATSAHVTEAAREVVDEAHALAGGTSVYDGSPLERRLRDLHTMSQHTWNGRDLTTLLGAVLSGEPVDPLLFSP